MADKREVENWLRANAGYTYEFANGFLDGMARARANQAPLKRYAQSSEPYPSGYRAGYNQIRQWDYRRWCPANPHDPLYPKYDPEKPRVKSPRTRKR